MANQAKYTLAIPHSDLLGNRLHDIAAAAHHWLINGPEKVDASHIQRDIEAHNGMHDFLVAIGEDSPRLDSTMKQLGHHIVDAANHPVATVMKEHDKGIQSWQINNMNYQPGVPSILSMSPQHDDDQLIADK